MTIPTAGDPLWNHSILGPVLAAWEILGEEGYGFAAQALEDALIPLVTLFRFIEAGGVDAADIEPVPPAD